MSASLVYVGGKNKIIGTITGASWVELQLGVGALAGLTTAEGAVISLVAVASGGDSAGSAFQINFDQATAPDSGYTQLPGIDKTWAMSNNVWVLPGASSDNVNWCVQF